jgi:hypothetical protein
LVRNVLIVGNGDVGEGVAALIDAAGFVVRFNDCNSYGLGGIRTDVVAVCNTGRPAKEMLDSSEWSNRPAVVAASQIWSVRDPAKFAALRPLLASTHPQLDDFCDDHTAQFEAFCTRTGKSHLVIDRTVHEDIDQALSAFGPTPYVVPSTGMIVIAEVLRKFPRDNVTLAGFGHTGWEGHPFAAEKQLIDSHIAAGRIRRLAPYPPAAYASGG